MAEAQEHERDSLYGLVARFETAEALVEAARRTREAGYTRIDAHTPFPIEGLAEALDLRKSPVPMMTLIGGVLGAGSAFTMQWYSATIGYPWNIAGRPPNSWPSFIPITFELGILGAGLLIFLSMFVLNGFPKPYHPVFNTPGFRRASRDRFFLSIEAADPRFDLRETRRILESLGPCAVYEVEW